MAAVDVNQSDLAWLTLLLRRRPLLRRMRTACMHAFKAVRICGATALLFVLGCGLIGLACFGNVSSSTVRSPSSIFSGTFHSAGEAFLTAARLLTGSNDWDEAAFSAMQLTGTAAAVIFYLSAQLAGGMIVVSLCTAFVLWGFDSNDTASGSEAAVAVHLSKEFPPQDRVDSARALAARVNTISADLETRIGIVKRHAAARVVETMRSQLASVGRIQGTVGRVFDWDTTSGSSPNAASATSSGSAPTAWKDRRLAFKAWIQSQSVVAPDGRTTLEVRSNIAPAANTAPDRRA